MKKVLYHLTIIILVIIIAICGIYIYKYLSEDRQAKVEFNKVKNIISETVGTESEPFNKTSFIALKKENPDTVGYLIWDSGIIEQPVVQAKDNDYYLRKSFYGNYYDAGTPFMDAYCNLNSTNMTIYGHQSYANPKNMFTPLTNINKSNYEENKSFKFYTENDIRYYEVAYVYQINEEQFQEYNFTQAELYSEEDYLEFLKFPTQHNRINTNVNLEYPNKFITLQTCKPWDSNTRIIVVAKETKVETY